jgi:dephospho-CoA kinase
MYLVGLTGGVATGKSTVAQMLSSLGVAVIDADAMARRVVQPGKRAYKKIRREFGDAVFHPDSGELDRVKLREIVFADEDLRRALERITHPEICREMCWEAARCALAGHAFAVLDLPLLFETGGAALKYMHKVIVVTCEEDLQMQRMMEQRSLSERVSKQMIDAQMALETKAAKADFVIENSGSLRDTEAQVLEVHRQLSKSRFHWKVRVAIGLAVGGVVGIVWLVAKLVKGAVTWDDPPPRAYRY